MQLSEATRLFNKPSGRCPKKKNLAFGSAILFSWLPHHFPSCHVRLPWPEPCPLADAISSVSYSFIHVLKVLFPLTCCCLSEKLHFSSIAEKMGFFRALTTQPQQRRRFDKSHAGCPGPLRVARTCECLSLSTSSDRNAEK